MELSIIGFLMLIIVTIIIGMMCMFLTEFIQHSIFKVNGSSDKHFGESILISLVICLTVWIKFIIMPILNVESEMTYDYSYNIYAIEDNMTIKGRRYYIEEDTRYYHLADYKDGKKMYSVDKNNSYIVEDNTTNPKIEVYKAKFAKSNWFKKILFESRDVEYKIIVPNKTLTDDFNIDMK